MKDFKDSKTEESNSLGRQTLYLNKILEWYEEQLITVGDPSEGRWEDCHSPLPRGQGDTTYKLLREHHVIHDLYQSWELDEQHVFVSEVKNILYHSSYFVENWFELCDIHEYFVKKLNLSRAKRGVELKTSGYLRKEVRDLATERRRESPKMKKWLDECSKSGHMERMSSFESCSKGGKKGGKNGGKSTSSQRWKCLVTGHVSTPGGLSSYQKSRGIDTSLRVKLS
jgi:hypothetical protein